MLAVLNNSHSTEDATDITFTGRLQNNHGTTVIDFEKKRNLRSCHQNLKLKSFLLSVITSDSGSSFHSLVVESRKELAA